MHYNHSKYFYETYPAIFLRRQFFYFAVGDGWFHPVDELCRSIMEHCDETGEEPPPCVQIKEKFGGLRFYTAAGVSEEIASLIGRAEAQCSITCDVCGASGEVREDNWMRVRCEEHVDG